MKVQISILFQHRNSLVGLLAILSMFAVGLTAHANPPGDLVGQPRKITIQPDRISLNGPFSTQQLIVTGHYADDKVRDLTAVSEFKTNDASIVTIAPLGLVNPRQDGETSITVKVAGQDRSIPIKVMGADNNKLVSFRHDVVAAMNVGGCNSGACHGTPSGKNGFKLSLRGYDPSADFLELTHDVRGRRVNRNQPEASLILKKALGQIPHDGGKRFGSETLAARVMLAWIAAGLPDDADTLPEVSHLEVVPGSRILHAPAARQQLAVLAHFSDGSVRDVTRLTVFSSSDEAIASVDRTGLVEFHKTGEVAVLCRYLQKMQPVRLAYLEPKEGFVWSNPPEKNYIDHHVFSKLKLLNIQPSELCTDEEYIRRAYLDLCAVLPTPNEVKTFLADKDDNKREKLIEQLLKRDEFADFWTLKWMDVLRSTRSKIGLDGAKAYQKWMRGHIRKNTPFDRVVNELLTAKGNTYQNGPANYYLATKSPEELAEATAQLFFGVRMQCAKCHNHPFEKWSQDDYYSTAAFFARVKQQSIGKKRKGDVRAHNITLQNSGDVRHLRTGQVMAPSFLGGTKAEIDKNADRREALAKWLTKRDNPFFARSLVNRIWFHLMGQGIVDPVDDFRDSNPSANDALLDALAKDFVEHQYDVKHLIRTIMQSRTYQLSAITNEFNREDNKYFSHAKTKLLTAEQLLDVICQVTQVPENFKGFPQGTRATQLPDGEVNHPFLKAFGQPARELPCECERGGDASLAQALQLLNGKTVHEKLTHRQNRLTKLLADKKISERDMVIELYLTTLSRMPSESEIKTNLGYIKGNNDIRRAWEDIQWALLNTKEFMFRH